MNIRTSYLYYQLDALPEINFSEQGIIDLADELYSELGQIGLSPADIAAFTGAVCNYYVRADQYDFSDNDPLLHTGPIQDWYAIWGAIKNAVSRTAGGLKYAAKSVTKSGANSVARKGAKFNKLIGANGLKSAVHVGGGQSEGFFKRIASGYKTGSQITNRMQFGSATANRINSSADSLRRFTGGGRSQSINALKVTNNIANQLKANPNMTESQLKGAFGNAMRSTGQTQVKTAAERAAQAGKSQKYASLKAEQEFHRLNSNISGEFLTQKGKNASANSQFYKRMAEKETDVNKKKEYLGKAKYNEKKLFSNSSYQDPKPQNAPKSNTTNTATPKPDKPNVTSSQTQNNTPKPKVTDTIKQKSQEMQTKAGQFMSGFKDKGGKVMGIGGEGMGKWASQNKAQAATAALGTAAAAYGAYRLLRGPKQQNPQQNNVNVNIQR